MTDSELLSALQAKEEAQELSEEQVAVLRGMERFMLMRGRLSAIQRVQASDWVGA